MSRYSTRPTQKCAPAAVKGRPRTATPHPGFKSAQRGAMRNGMMPMKKTKHG